MGPRERKNANSLLCNPLADPCKAVIDMAPVSPEWAVSCVEAGMPYMAICYAEAHATLLNQCLSHRIFQKFTDESESMFAPRAA
eukprot:1147736-Pyramimonas_sp.AAC.1